MKTRLFTIMFALLAMVTGAWADEYGIYICGVMVTDDNMNSLSSIDGVNGGTITFDGTTLTLTDVTIDASDKPYYGMSHMRNDLTIHLEGTNKIISDYAAVCLRGNTTITGPGKLEATGKEHGIMLENLKQGYSVRLTTQDGAHIVAKGDKYGIYGNTSSSESVLIYRTTKAVEAWGGDGSFFNTSAINILNPMKVMKPIGAKVSATGSDIVDADGNVVKGEWVKIAEPVGLAINETNFPDPIFRAYVINKLDDGDGYLTDQEIAAVTEINVSYNYKDVSTNEYKNIATLQGIEHFTALTTLKCSRCSLTSLDMTDNAALEYLDCSWCKLTELGVSNNAALNYLDCSFNSSLGSLYVASNVALEYLDCSYTGLDHIILFPITALKKLYCDGNPLNFIDPSKNTMLTELSCSNCQLGTFLDVSNNTALEKLWCDRNQLTSLNVKNTSLKLLRCSRNRINGVAMDDLIADLPQAGGDFQAIAPSYDDEQNMVTVKQVAAAKKNHWTTYYMYSEEGLWAEYAGLTPPEGLDIDEINFPDANFRRLVAMFFDDGNGVLVDEEIAAAKEMYFSGQGIADLTGIEHFTELTTLYCANNSITTIDPSIFPNLQMFDCSGNQLTSLDVSQNFELFFLGCSDNQLTSLDVWSNSRLMYLYCEKNQIKGASMNQLISSFRRYYSNEGKFYAINLTDPNERNVVTTEQVQLAKQRGWTTYGYVEDWEEYAGSGGVPTTISAVSGETTSDSPYYSLDGQRMSGQPTKKGVYVRDGRKVVVK